MADGRAAQAAGNRPSSQTPAMPPSGSRAGFPRLVRRRPHVVVDREEITVIGRLPEPEGEQSEARASGRVSRFREETRPERMRIADEAQDKYGRKVSWGIEIGAVGDDSFERILFTHIAVPVMTRLKQPERQVLDTLVDAGVARSRSDALAWSVKLVGEHTEEWLTKLRDAMRNVDDLRSEGPQI